ncbi:hypothetical protein [Deinococcus deserti]|uniref:Uncharacterized protein n=1 Tax=Deinococcus deserti (strain DSM 17065 / CIP 109153 / LMG 22923 / VCD115) TaxID=546414 RepID=C1D1K0_DEIDV|nr:hypothetical protein [Deinococcus deserti]ACO45724.1 hypothetical protein Deide_08520 [Deinococcus deserti VCD115]
MNAPENQITLNADQWEKLLAGLYERDDRLELREAGQTYPNHEAVDAYVLSGHAEALRSADVDGDIWETLEDLDETAADEEEAWAKICAFYLERGCVLVRVSGMEEPEEWILTAELARRLGLI